MYDMFWTSYWRQCFDWLAGILCRTPQPEVNRPRIFSSQQPSVVPEWSVRHLYSTSDNAPVLQYHLHWLRYFTHLHFLPHFYHIPTLWDSGTGLWELAIHWVTTTGMYLATCNMPYCAVFYFNELQTSGCYHQNPDKLISPTFQSITFLWNSRTSYPYNFHVPGTCG